MLQPREPFILMRSRRKSKASEPSFVVDEVGSCTNIISLKKQGCDVVQLLVAHGQRADDMAIFLYSILDVPVQHAFFLNIAGEMNMKNFQRFESKAKSESVTVLNTVCKVMEAVNYDTLRTLILVSCTIMRLSLDGLPNLELIDVRHNKLDHLPDALVKCKKLKTIKCAGSDACNLFNDTTAFGERSSCRGHRRGVYRHSLVVRRRHVRGHHCR